MRKHFKKIIWAEILLLAAYIIFLANVLETPGKAVDIPAEAWRSHYIDPLGEWSVTEGQIPEASGTAVDLIFAPYIPLEKGYYDIDIRYSCDSTQSARPYANGENLQLIDGHLFTLLKTRTHETYSFRLTEDIDNFEVQIKYNGKGDFAVSGIRITASHAPEKIGLLWLLLFFGVLDAFVILSGKPREVRFSALSVILIALVSSLPLFMKGYNMYNLHDSSFHLMRIEGIVSELRYGHFPVRIGSAWLGGYGYPVSIFYGDALLYFPALLRICGVPLIAATKIYIFAVNLVTSWTAVVCFNRMFASRRIGAFTALLFMTSPYRLVDVYVRSAVGEYSAMIFFPPAALAFWNMCTGKNTGKTECRRNALLLGVSMAGIIATHVLSAEMSVFVLVLSALVLYRKFFTQDNLLTVCRAAGTALLLSAFFLVPFLDYYLNVPVNITSTIHADEVTLIGQNAIPFPDLFAFFSSPFGEGEKLLCTPGIVLMAALAFSIWLWTEGKASTQTKILTLLSLLMLLLATNIFPWDFLSLHSRTFRFLSSIQFPWRFIAFATLLLTILTGNLLQEHAAEPAESTVFSGLLPELVLATVLMTCVFTSFYADEATRYERYDLYDINTYSVISAEYLRTEPGSLTRIEQIRDEQDGRFKGENTVYIAELERWGTDFLIGVKTNDSEAVVTAPIQN